GGGASRAARASIKRGAIVRASAATIVAAKARAARPLVIAVSLSHPGFPLQRRAILEAIVAGEAADRRLPFPVVEDAADVFPGDAGHGGKIALTDLLPDQHAAAVDLVPEGFGKVQQDAGDPSLQRQKAPGGD